ncbi:MAG TPA: hypothetical protein VGG33_18055 [Polyangia bacterium]
MRDRSAAPSGGLSFEALGTCALLLVVFLLGCLMPMQNDSWWHLRVGQDIVATGRVPVVDYLSYTAAGRPWPNHEWLAQVIFYGTHRVGGLPLLQLLGAVLMTGAWALIATTMNPRWRPIVLGLVLPLSASGWSLRPQLFTAFFLALMIRLLVRGRAGWLAVLFPVWANLHSGVLIAAPVLGAAIVVSYFRDRRVLPVRLALLAAWALGSMATPLGPGIFAHVAGTLASPVARLLTEWQPARFGHGLSMLFMAESALLLLLVVRRLRRPPVVRRWEDDFLGLLALMFVPLGLRSVRHISLAAMALAPALSWLAPERAGATATAEATRTRANTALLAMLLVGGLASVFFLWRLPLARLGWRPMSPAAAAAIAACPDPLYNRYDDGGFLLWFVQGKRVFLDSRHDPYPHELMLAQFRVQESGEPGPLFERFGFRCAVLPPDDRLATSLHTRAWRTAFADDQWWVLIAPWPAEKPKAAAPVQPTQW